MDERSELGLELEEALREAIAYRKGEVALPTRIVDPMPPARVKAIRTAVSRNPKDFEARNSAYLREHSRDGNKGVARRILRRELS